MIVKKTPSSLPEDAQLLDCVDKLVEINRLNTYQLRHLGLNRNYEIMSPLL